MNRYTHRVLSERGDLEEHLKYYLTDSKSSLSVSYCCFLCSLLKNLYIRYRILCQNLPVSAFVLTIVALGKEMRRSSCTHRTPVILAALGATIGSLDAVSLGCLSCRVLALSSVEQRFHPRVIIPFIAFRGYLASLQGLWESYNKIV